MEMNKEERKLEKLNTSLDGVIIENKARKIGFVVRHGKIQPVDFIKAFCLMTFYRVCSLRICATALGLLSNHVISKQGLSKRLTPKCVEFFRNILFLFLAKQSNFKEASSNGQFKFFSRVLLQDSTNLSLPKKLAEYFPGSKNQNNKSIATMKIQSIYDALSESFISFKLTPYTCNDQSLSSYILTFLQAKDLVLRDLGYFKVKILKEIADKGAYFLSRYLYKTAIYNEQKERINLLEYLRKHKMLDISVYIGYEVKLPVRLVAIPLQQEVYSKRKMKLRQNRDKRLKKTKEQLELLEWEIFITNVPDSVWNTRAVAKIYDIRWRIEIIFKAWKSHFNLRVMTKGSRYHIETLIYAKLIWITLFQNFFRQLYLYVFVTTGKHLSLLKIAQFCQQNFWALMSIFNSNEKVGVILEQFIRHCCYEKRKKRSNYPEFMLALSLG
jgi:hypothetical protein